MQSQLPCILEGETLPKALVITTKGQLDQIPLPGICSLIAPERSLTWEVPLVTALQQQSGTIAIETMGRANPGIGTTRRLQNTLKNMVLPSLRIWLLEGCGPRY